MQLETEKRLVQTISGDRCDRVPTAPLFYYFAGRHAGFTTAELVNSPRNYRIAMERCWEDFGPWDVYYPLNAVNRTMMSIAMPIKSAYPGVELPENESVQFIEEEIMKPEDYDLMLEPLANEKPTCLRAGLPKDYRNLNKKQTWSPPFRVENSFHIKLCEQARTLQLNEPIRSLKACFQYRENSYHIKLPDFFKSAYGDWRDPAAELEGHIDFIRTLIKLLTDSSINGSLTLRYLQFILRMSARIRGERSMRLPNVANGCQRVPKGAKKQLQATSGNFKQPQATSFHNILDTLFSVFLAAYEQLDFTRYDFIAWRERGVTPLFGMGLEGPFDSFSLARSMIPFTTDDLFIRPDKIKKCSQIAVDFFTAMAELGTALTGIPRFIYACHRTSNDFISPTHFRELAFPSMREITSCLVNRGITLIFHCDGNWNDNLKYLAQLPEGKCVFQFEGRTDIFLARKILGEGHCIFGDVPAVMLAHADKSDVTAYCKRLINEVGKNGRFILGAGCEIPPDAKPENVRAMLRAPYESWVSYP